MGKIEHRRAGCVGESLNRRDAKTAKATTDRKIEAGYRPDMLVDGMVN